MFDPDKLLNIYQTARDLISDPTRWTKGAYGRNTFGDRLAPNEIEKAVCFCSVRAIYRAAGTHTPNYSSEDYLFEPLAKRINPRSEYFGPDIIKQQDHPSTRHEDVLCWFDGAIAQLKREVSGA